MAGPLITRRQFGALAGAGALLTFEPMVGPGARAQARVKLTAAEAVETLYYLPLYVAHARGFFEQEGLDITIYNAQQRTIALRAIVSGDAFSYNGDPAEPALARQRGAEVKNIGVLVNRVAQVIAAKKGVAKDPKMWKGQKIIVPRPPHTGVSVVQMVLLDAGFTQGDTDGLLFKAAGSTGDKDNVQLVPVIAGSELAALSANQADLATLIEPDTSNAVMRGFEVLFTFADFFGPFLFTSFAVTEKSIKETPELVQKFVNAMTKACIYGHKYPEKAAQVAIERYKDSDPAIMKDAALRTIAQGAYPKNLLVTKESYDKNFGQLLVRTGHPAANYPFAELMDLRFAEKAAAQFSEKDV
ncbi:MAG: ABC transporter substrate-binding protein [Alphaproteobacteria bacterium]|nr:ABC transporter substrate-binding protein [Alphaproteobacteria bacterium]